MMPRLLALALLAGLPVASAVDGPAANLPRSSPEAQGISSSALLAFVNAAEAKIDALHSFMVVRHGYVVAEGWWSPYQKDDPHMLFSLSKSFTSTGIGLAAAEGRLPIDDPFKFADDRLVLDREYNVALGDAPTRRPLLVGQAEGSRLGRFDADHVLWPDGTMLGISDQSINEGRSTIFTVPTGGGGPEINLTNLKGLDDGPEYSPDGKYIYFNSARSGTMQIWRMKPDGRDPEPVTNDEYNNWFPHVSPDGQWIAFISFP